MEDPLMYEPKKKSSFAMMDPGATRPAADPVSGSRCLLVLLALNLLVSSTLLVGFFVSVFQVKAEVKSIRESSTALNQLGRLWRTNTDLSTWRETLSTVSKLADQVKDIDWTVEESYVYHSPRGCDDYPMSDDKATCESFVGDDNKKCKWTEGQGCEGNAMQINYPTTQKLEVDSRSSKYVQDFLAQLKKGLDTIISKLPSADDTKKQAAGGKTSQVCASAPVPIVVEDDSILDVPVLTDTMVKDLPCFAHESEDQLNIATKDSVSSVMSGLQSMNILCNYNGPDTQQQIDICLQDATDIFMAYRNIYLDLVKKYTSVVDAQK